MGHSEPPDSESDSDETNLENDEIETNDGTVGGLQFALGSLSSMQVDDLTIPSMQMTEFV